MSTHLITRRFFATTLMAGACLLGSAATAGAQTTLTLNAPGTQVTDVTIQAGAFANTNFNKTDVLATQASANFDAPRRALIKFDTENTIPARTTIQSAFLTLTLKDAGTDATRSIGVFPVTTSFVQENATWVVRRAGSTWTQLGGDLGPQSTAFTSPNAAGAKVSVDVTALVQTAVSGATSSRYTRLALADLGGASDNSGREFFSSKAVDPSVRPVLTVVYGGAATAPQPPPPPQQTVPPAVCPVGLDKVAFVVGSGQANWPINVTAASDCTWTATTDVSWLIVMSTMPATAAGNGYAKMRAVANTVSSAKRIGHVTVNGVVYTVTQGGCGSSCATPPPPPPPVIPPASNTLRVLQYNTHHGGWSSAATPTYDPNKIVDWVVKANPDVVSMNELEVGDSWSKGLDQSDLYKTLLEQRTGVTWYKVFVNAHGATTGIGNAVFSKYPFIATGSTLLTAGRAAVDATISVNGRTINVTSTHLDNVTQSNRIKETGEVIAWETTLAEDRIVCGDWNGWPGTTEVTNMQATYVETWSAAKTLGTAIGNGITHGSHQIDYIFLSKTAAHTTLKSVQIFNTADANGISPSDHQPLLAIFEVQ